MKELPSDSRKVMPKKCPIVIVGFGSQARAWALNLRDSKIDLRIALRPHSSSLHIAETLGFQCISLETDELKNYSLFIMLTPDDSHSSFFKKNDHYLKANSHFIYAHGFSLSKDRLHERFPHFSHSLLAPKAIASDVRFQYETKGKIGAAYFASDAKAELELKALAEQVGFTAIYQSHFDEECLADLFSEQSLLCSLIPYGALKSYNMLRAHGISKEVAFMECYLELKSISQAFVNLGPEAFFKLISPNALIGSQKGRQILLNESFDQGLEKILVDIKNKEFYKEVEIDAELLRSKILEEWRQEELSQTFKTLKAELIV